MFGHSLRAQFRHEHQVCFLLRAFKLFIHAADELFHDELTEEVVNEFENAASRLGAYN